MLAHETVRLGQDLVSIAKGTDDHTPAEKDKRFADPAWRVNPAYRRIGQTYSAWGSSLGRMVDRYEAEGADWRDVERARFALNALVSGMAPTNTLLGNSSALAFMEFLPESSPTGVRLTLPTTSGATCS